MTVTLSSDYTTWTVTSTRMSDWTDIDTVKLYINTDSYDATEDDTEFEIESNPEDGVYQFILEIVYDDNTVIREKACYFVDEEFKCKVVSTVYNTGEDRAALYYYLLKNSNPCTDCDKLKELFNIANNLVNDNCGCN